MAISAPSNPLLDSIPSVKDPSNYVEEMFNTSPDPSIHTFKTFLEDSRGISFDSFSHESKLLLALIMETTIYSQYCAALRQAAQQGDQASDEASRAKDWAQSVSVEDIDSALTALDQRTAQLREMRAAKTNVS